MRLLRSGLLGLTLILASCSAEENATPAGSDVAVPVDAWAPEDAPLAADAPAVEDVAGPDDVSAAQDKGATPDPGPVPDPGPSLDAAPVSDVPAPDPGPWTQCTGDEPCKALFGAGGYCNLDFPGGQCWGCESGSMGDAQCTQLGKDGNTLSCKEGLGLCLFDCPCPPWLKCLGDVCALRTCTDSAECAPFLCRPLSPDGTSYCLDEDE